MNKLKELIKADIMGFIGLHVSVFITGYAIHERVWPVAAITGLASLGLIYGIYRTYTKLK